ncbi:hypothetical protein EGH90_12840 [Kaistella haifensis]|nr:hypothetical protein EGH90_12840 [Kaistella haifensis]
MFLVKFLKLFFVSLINHHYYLIQSNPYFAPLPDLSIWVCKDTNFFSLSKFFLTYFTNKFATYCISEGKNYSYGVMLFVQE